MRRSRAMLLSLGIAGLISAVAAGCGSSDGTTTNESAAALAPVSGIYSPRIDPSRFSERVDNPFMPWGPGTVNRYTGVAEDGKTPQVITVTVTNRTKRILGVDCVVVQDVNRVDGEPEESTLDWYAQDAAGNVWYFGEASFDFKGGHWVRSSGSWQGGVDGAKPGIVMPATPAAGESYRQEYYAGHAEDEARILGNGGPLKVPFASYPQTLATYESSPLEPDVAEKKFYVRGVGEVRSVMVKGGEEVTGLASVSR